MDIAGPSQTLVQFGRKHNLGRSKLFDEIAEGRLQVARLGPRKILVTARQEQAYLELLETEATRKKPGIPWQHKRRDAAEPAPPARRGWP